MILHIKRYNPEKDENSFFEKFEIAPQEGMRVLDALIHIKNTRDGALTFRRSCAHGICGSCAMKINGENRLACQTLIDTSKKEIFIEPLHSFPVIRDLVTDMSFFFELNERILPFLINDETPPERERFQSQEEVEDISESITCIMCGSCTSACPSHRHNSKFPGPSALLKSYRFIFDSRDKALKERIGIINRPDGLWKCRTILNCTETCPKNIRINHYISKLKRFICTKQFSILSALQ